MVSGTYSCFQYRLSLFLWAGSGTAPRSLVWRCSLSYQELRNDDGDGNENFQKQYVCTIPDSQVSLVEMKPFRYRRNVLVQKPILNMWHSEDPYLQIREGPGHPDPEISGEGGRGLVSKKNFATLQASNGLKMQGAPVPPGPSPDPPLWRSTVQIGPAKILSVTEPNWFVARQFEHGW